MQKQTTSRQAGFTLVELLVVLAISGIVLGAILEIFNSSNKTYAVQEEVAAMQQNLRAAKMFLARDIRMAGSGLTGYSDPNGSRVYGLGFTNNIGNDINGNPATDQININYIAFDGDGCGVDPDPTDTTPLCDVLPPLTLLDAMPPTSSVAQVENDFQVAPANVWDAACVCNGITYTQPTPGFMALITSPDGTMQNTFFGHRGFTGRWRYQRQACERPFQPVGQQGGQYLPGGKHHQFFQQPVHPYRELCYCQ